MYSHPAKDLQTAGIGSLEAIRGQPHLIALVNYKWSMMKPHAILSASLVWKFHVLTSPVIAVESFITASGSG